LAAKVPSLQAEAISVAAWGFLDCFASLAMGGRALNYALLQMPACRVTLFAARKLLMLRRAEGVLKCRNARLAARI
jgi:hypothetical protein